MLRLPHVMKIPGMRTILIAYHSDRKYKVHLDCHKSSNTPCILDQTDTVPAIIYGMAALLFCDYEEGGPASTE